MITRDQVKVGDILQLNDGPTCIKVVTKLEENKLLCARCWWDGDVKENDFIFYSSLECNNYRILPEEEFIAFASSLIENKKREYETYKNGVTRWIEKVSEKVKMLSKV